MNAKQFRNRKYKNCPASNIQLDGTKNVYRDNLKPIESCRGGIISNCQDMGQTLYVCPTNVSLLFNT